MSIGKRVIKNTGFLYAKMGITMFLSLYTTRLVLNALGTADFGIFNVVGGAIAMLGFLNAAMAGATQRFMNFYERNTYKTKIIFNISIVLHIAIAILIASILMIIGYFFLNRIININSERIFAAKVVYGSLVVSACLSVISAPYDALLNAHENMLYYSILGVVESLLKLSVAVIINNIDYDKLIIYALLMGFIPIMMTTIMRLYCHKKYEECVIAPLKYWDKNILKQMTSFTGWSFIGNVASSFSTYGNGIVINNFFGTIPNAAQGIAGQINGQLSVLSTSLMKALSPNIVKAESTGDRDQMLKLGRIGSKIMFALTAYIAIPVFIETEILFKLWLTIVPPYAIIFTRLLILKNLLDQFNYVLNISIISTGNIKDYELKSSIVIILPLFVIAPLFYLGLDVSVSYIVYVLFTVFLLVQRVYFANKLLGLNINDYWVKVIIKSLLAFGISVMLTIIVSNQIYLTKDLLRLFKVTIISSFFYTAIFYFLVLNSQEKIYINRILLTIYSRVRFKIG